MLKAVHSPKRGIGNIDETSVGTDFIVVPSVFIGMRTGQNSNNFFTSRKWDGAANSSPSSNRSFNYLDSRLINDPVVEGL